MAAPVGALTIDMSLNSAAFIRDMGKSQKALASNSARMNKALGKLDRGFTKVLRSSKRMAKSMVSMRGVMAGVAGAAGIGLLVKSSIDFADSIGKTADAIGISTATLQEWRFAMDISGVATEKTDKGLKKFVRNMGELERSSSETQTALKDLDPALLANLRSLDSVEDQLVVSRRALAGYTSQSKRAAVAQALLGRAGVDMTVAFKDGSAAFEALLQKARDLGIVLEEKLIRNAERAKDELTVLAQVIKVKVIGAVVAFAPEIADLATKFADGIPKIVAWVEAFGKFVGLIDERRVERINAITAEIDDLQKTIARFDKPRLNLIFPTEGLKARVAELRGLLFDLAREQAKLTAGSTAAGTAPAKPGAAAAGPPAVRPNRFRPGHEDEDLIAGIEQAARARRELATAEFNTAEAIRRTTREMMREAEQTAVLITATTQGTAALRAQTEIFDLQNAALAQGVDLTSRQGEAWEAGFREVQIFNRGLEDTQREMEAARRETELLAAGISVVLGDALAGSIRSWKDLGRVAIGVIQDILREQLRAAATAKAAGGGGGFSLGSIFGSIAGLFGGGGASAQVAGDLAGQVAFATPFAHGGRPPVGRPALVGERGPELFVPDRPGRIIPNDALRGGGGVSITQNFDFRGADAGVFARAQLFKEQIKAETVAAVFGLIDQGGSEAKLSGRRRR